MQEYAKRRDEFKCEDRDAACAKWADRGDCISNAAVMVTFSKLAITVADRHTSMMYSGLPMGLMQPRRLPYLVRRPPTGSLLPPLLLASCQKHRSFKLLSCVSHGTGDMCRWESMRPKESAWRHVMPVPLAVLVRLSCTTCTSCLTSASKSWPVVLLGWQARCDSMSNSVDCTADSKDFMYVQRICSCGDQCELPHHAGDLLCQRRSQRLKKQAVLAGKQGKVSSA
jgi:hypothetical protein